MIMLLIMFAPIMALVLFMFFPFWTAIPVYIGILLFTVFVYLKMFSSMKQKVKTGREWMIGEVAEVIKDINPEGKVDFEDEIWSAASRGKSFRKGEKVKICGFQGMQLIVDEKKENGDQNL
jgi:membrane-bound ClpP family serine protease